LRKTLKNVESPCVRNCCLNEQDICLGCFRSLEEIKQWSSSNNQDKQKVIDKAKLREQQKKW